MSEMCVCALGEAPSQVEITNVSTSENGGVTVVWKAPSIPNGVIEEYQVQIRLLNKKGQILFVKNDDVMVGGYVSCNPTSFPQYGFHPES